MFGSGVGVIGRRPPTSSGGPCTGDPADNAPDTSARQTGEHGETAGPVGVQLPNAPAQWVGVRLCFRS
jgi:hypothetical protein